MRRHNFYEKVALIPPSFTQLIRASHAHHFSSALLVLAGVGDGGIARVERGRGERHFDNSLQTAADDAGSI